MVQTRIILVAIATLSNAQEYPSNINLKVGVLLAPPFAMLNADGEYHGFIPDLLHRLTTFAKEDGVNLNFDLSNAPVQYNSALDLIANDCNTTINPNTLSDCSKFDIIAGDYYVNPPRSIRINFTPAWLRTTITTISKAGVSKSSSSTLDQIEAANGTICVPDGTFIMSVVMEKFPKANFYKCETPIECVEKLKADGCSQYADDELLLRYRVLNDADLQLNRNNFNTQYLVWPTSYKINTEVSILLNKWIYAAIVNTTLDELYDTYFSYKLCPIGTAGKNCTEFCHPKYGEADIEGKCVCDSTKWTGADCSIEVMHDKNLIPKPLKIVAYSLYAVLVVIITLCFFWLHKNRKTPQVISYQPFFLKLILIGCLISSSAIIVFGVESNDRVSSAVCMLSPWLYSIGFSIVFGALIAKTRRVHIIFRDSARMRRTTVTMKETFLYITFILLVDIAILTAWSIVDPLHWVRTVTVSDKYGDPLSSQAGCTCDNPWIWIALLGTLHVSLLLLLSYMCYQARFISTRYSEAKYLRTSIFLNTQVYLIGVPVIIITRDDPKARFFVSCIIIIFDVLVVIGSIFGGLIHNVTVGEDHHESMNGALRTYIRKSSLESTSFRNSLKSQMENYRRRSSTECLHNSAPEIGTDENNSSVNEEITPDIATEDNNSSGNEK